MRVLKFIVLLLLGLTFTTFAQSSCCSSEKTTEVSFAEFGNDESFREKHETPAAYTLLNPKGKMITYPVSDGDDANAYFVKSPEESDKWIFVFHEWWGLNDYVKREADELQEKLGNVNILALDLYDGKVTDKREEASAFMQSVETERAYKIIHGAIDFAGDDTEVGTIGWCFGGGWSLQASIWLEDKGEACVMYYGIIDNTPETFKDLEAPVLGIFAEKDGWVTPEVYGNLEKNLKDAGIEVTIKSYDADHAFANPSNPKFDKEATEDAKKLTIEFFKEFLMD